ncbi:MAG: AMP-binding protein [Rhizobiaceae bacterium]|nr:AMP-binding protein [Rhizobiaceae bacterium]
MPESLSNPERLKASVADIITRNAELYPDRVAIDDLLSGRRLTYAELQSRIIRLARGFSKLGIGKGDIVAVMLWNEHAIVETMMACAHLGAVFAPLNVRWIAEEVAEYANYHECKAVVTREDFAERFSAVDAPVRVICGKKDGWHGFEDLIASNEDTPLPAISSMEEPFRLISTGGTTGMSKGVVHSHVGTYFTVLSNIAEFGLRRFWSTIMIAPAYHGAGTDWGMLPVLWRGGTVVFPADVSFNPHKFIAEIRSRNIEFLLLVPAVIDAMYRVWDGVPMDSPRTVISTSAPTPPALRKKLAEMFPRSDLLAGAGISESVNMIIQSPGDFLDFPFSAGQAHLDTRLLIVDEQDQSVPRGTPGQIILRGFNTALLYHKNETAGAATWRQRQGDPEGLYWCFTGDIGVMDADGRVSIVDRSKDIILTGGETVPSVEIETVYFDNPDVAECAAIGLPDERWGEVITLVVVKRNAQRADHELAEELFRYGREKLSGYKIPKQLAFIDALPRSHFGKVLKRDLRTASFSMLYRPFRAEEPGKEKIA